jgi:hypothetical protein
MGLLGLAFATVIVQDCLMRFYFAKLSSSSPHRFCHEIVVRKDKLIPRLMDLLGQAFISNVMRLSHEFAIFLDSRAWLI